MVPERAESHIYLATLLDLYSVISVIRAAYFPQRGRLQGLRFLGAGMMRASAGACGDTHPSASSSGCDAQETLGASLSSWGRGLLTAVATSLGDDQASRQRRGEGLRRSLRSRGGVQTIGEPKQALRENLQQPRPPRGRLRPPAGADTQEPRLVGPSADAAVPCEGTATQGAGPTAPSAIAEAHTQADAVIETTKAVGAEVANSDITIAPTEAMAADEVSVKAEAEACHVPQETLAHAQSRLAACAVTQSKGSTQERKADNLCMEFFQDALMLEAEAVVAVTGEEEEEGAEEEKGHDKGRNPEVTKAKAEEESQSADREPSPDPADSWTLLG